MRFAAFVLQATLCGANIYARLLGNHTLLNAVAIVATGYVAVYFLVTAYQEAQK